VRIQSTFKDYYDTGMAHGHDDSLVYMRYPKEIEVPKKSQFWCAESWRYGKQPIEYMSTLIGFCGRVWTLLDVAVAYGFYTGDRPPRRLCYKIEEMDAFVKTHFKEEVYDEYLHGAKNYRKAVWPWMRGRADIVKSFPGPVKQERYDKVFEEHRCPIFVVRTEPRSRKQTLLINPPLKDYEFIRVMDPYQAFQEISMFLGNMAEPRKPIPKMSDEDMASIKGFDKYSFRKDPSSKKRRK
jgi:hypothetical protein